MLLEPVWNIVERDVFYLPSSEGLFNPYADREDAYDVPGAEEIRRQNFRQYLECYLEWPRLFLLAEAPGPWGCRFSGVPLVSEAQLVEPAFPINGRPTSLAPEPHSEYTAGIYWRVLGAYFPYFFTWNSVPFHPFKPGNAMSIRNPRNGEVMVYADVLRAILDVMNPEIVLAIGRKAEYVLGKLGVECRYIRHPSQGGARKFEEGVGTVLGEMGL